MATGPKDDEVQPVSGGDRNEGPQPPVENLEMQEVLHLVRNEGAKPEVERNHHTKVYKARDKKVNCEVRCSVITVGEVDTVKQEFEADIFLSLRWREKKFDDREEEVITDNEQWDPRVYFPNSVAINERYRQYDVQFVKTGGSNVAYVYLEIRTKVTFKTAMKLGKFPFDFQELTIKMTSSWRSKYINFQRRLTDENKIMDNIYMDTFTGKHEWNLQEHIVCTPGDGSEESTKRRSNAPESNNEFTPLTHDQSNTIKGLYPTYYIKLHVQRKPCYYVWNVVVPVFCILALSFTSFVIDADDPSGRLSVNVILLLTAVACKSFVSTLLPRISYLTFLDLWLLLNFGLQCIIVAQNAIIGARCWDENRRKCGDLVCGIVLGGAAGAVNIIFIVIGICQYVRAKRKLAKITQTYKNNKALTFQ